MECSSCGNVFVLKEDRDGTALNYWTDAEDRIYCDQCFYELYTNPEECALVNWDHPNKQTRLKARKLINELNRVWGIA